MIVAARAGPSVRHDRREPAPPRAANALGSPSRASGSGVGSPRASAFSLVHFAKGWQDFNFLPLNGCSVLNHEKLVTFGRGADFTTEFSI